MILLKDLTLENKVRMVNMINIAKPLIGQEEKDAVIKVLDSGAIASGKTVSEFENVFSNYIGTKFGIATSSGTTALEIALRAAGIKNGDKVLTTPFSFIASTNSILYTGAIPVFADIDEKSFNISPDSIEEILRQEKDIKALLVVHLYGQSCDMSRIAEIVKKYKLILIEDCAQAHGAEWDGKKVGTFGDVAAFSFYPTKNMTTSEGGMITTNNEEIANRARLLINHGMKIRYFHDEIGYNYRMTNIAAAIGICQLKKLDGFNNSRIENAAFFDEKISNELVVKPYINGKAKHVYHQYSICITNGKRNEFIKHLEENEIGYGIYYPLSIPEQKCYMDFKFKNDYEVTDRIKFEILSIPVHPALTIEEKNKIVETINIFRR